MKIKKTFWQSPQGSASKQKQGAYSGEGEEMTNEERELGDLERELLELQNQVQTYYLEHPDKRSEYPDKIFVKSVEELEEKITEHIPKKVVEDEIVEKRVIDKTVTVGENPLDFSMMNEIGMPKQYVNAVFQAEEEEIEEEADDKRQRNSEYINDQGEQNGTGLSGSLKDYFDQFMATDTAEQSGDAGAASEGASEAMKGAEGKTETDDMEGQPEQITESSAPQGLFKNRVFAGGWDTDAGAFGQGDISGNTGNIPSEGPEESQDSQEDAEDLFKRLLSENSVDWNILGGSDVSSDPPPFSEPSMPSGSRAASSGPGEAEAAMPKEAESGISSLSEAFDIDYDESDYGNSGERERGAEGEFYNNRVFNIKWEEGDESSTGQDDFGESTEYYSQDSNDEQVNQEDTIQLTHNQDQEKKTLPAGRGGSGKESDEDDASKSDISPEVETKIVKSPKADNLTAARREEVFSSNDESEQEDTDGGAVSTEQEDSGADTVEMDLENDTNSDEGAELPELSEMPDESEGNGQWFGSDAEEEDSPSSDDNDSAKMEDVNTGGDKGGPNMNQGVSFESREKDSSQRAEGSSGVNGGESSSEQQGKESAGQNSISDDLAEMLKGGGNDDSLPGDISEGESGQDKEGSSDLSSDQGESADEMLNALLGIGSPERSSSGNSSVPEREARQDAGTGTQAGGAGTGVAAGSEIGSGSDIVEGDGTDRSHMGASSGGSLEDWLSGLSSMGEMGTQTGGTSEYGLDQANGATEHSVGGGKDRTDSPGSEGERQGKGPMEPLSNQTIEDWLSGLSSMTEREAQSENTSEIEVDQPERTSESSEYDEDAADTSDGDSDNLNGADEGQGEFEDSDMESFEDSLSDSKLTKREKRERRRQRLIERMMQEDSLSRSGMEQGGRFGSEGVGEDRDFPVSDGRKGNDKTRSGSGSQESDPKGTSDAADVSTSASGKGTGADDGDDGKLSFDLKSESSSSVGTKPEIDIDGKEKAGAEAGKDEMQSGTQTSGADGKLSFDLKSESSSPVGTMPGAETEEKGNLSTEAGAGDGDQQSGQSGAPNTGGTGSDAGGTGRADGGEAKLWSDLMAESSSSAGAIPKEAGAFDGGMQSGSHNTGDLSSSAEGKGTGTDDGDEGKLSFDLKSEASSSVGTMPEAEIDEQEKASTEAGKGGMQSGTANAGKSVEGNGADGGDEGKLSFDLKSEPSSSVGTVPGAGIEEKERTETREGQSREGGVQSGAQNAGGAGQSAGGAGQSTEGAGADDGDEGKLSFDLKSESSSSVGTIPGADLDEKEKVGAGEGGVQSETQNAGDANLPAGGSGSDSGDDGKLSFDLKTEPSSPVGTIPGTDFNKKEKEPSGVGKHQAEAAKAASTPDRGDEHGLPPVTDLGAAAFRDRDASSTGTNSGKSKDNSEKLTQDAQTDSKTRKKVTGKEPSVRKVMNREKSKLSQGKSAGQEVQSRESIKSGQIQGAEAETRPEDQIRTVVKEKLVQKTVQKQVPTPSKEIREQPGSEEGNGIKTVINPEAARRQERERAIQEKLNAKKSPKQLEAERARAQEAEMFAEQLRMLLSTPSEPEKTSQVKEVPKRVREILVEEAAEEKEVKEIKSGLSDGPEAKDGTDENRDNKEDSLPKEQPDAAEHQVPTNTVKGVQSSGEESENNASGSGTFVTLPVSEGASDSKTSADTPSAAVVSSGSGSDSESSGVSPIAVSSEGEVKTETANEGREASSKKLSKREKQRLRDLERKKLKQEQSEKNAVPVAGEQIPQIDTEKLEKGISVDPNQTAKSTVAEASEETVANTEGNTGVLLDSANSGGSSKENGGPTKQLSKREKQRLRKLEKQKIKQERAEKEKIQVAGEAVPVAGERIPVEEKKEPEKDETVLDNLPATLKEIPKKQKKPSFWKLLLEKLGNLFKPSRLRHKAEPVPTLGDFGTHQDVTVEYADGRINKLEGVVEGDVRGESIILEIRSVIKSDVVVTDCFHCKQKSNVFGNVYAKKVIVEGTVTGDIQALQSVEIKDGGCVLGNVQAPVIHLDVKGYAAGNLTYEKGDMK